MEANDVRIGDLVRIRQWDDMMSEFKDPDSTIYFTKEMKFLCGMEFEVMSIFRGLRPDEVYVSGHNIWYPITNFMIEPVDGSNVDNREMVSYLEEQWLT